ncbi:MFS transporter [Rhodocytophaga aerolata]|uniref:MFS transporter n=1 Tax=Rhodocytophaga aerolata TaxID=455078 RepID=A0ABT8REC9_9BACT|nr:MFS transporter [Rhodocytophaga aerolata]MDO1450455.1 MFS transporter [Rhodocytophaga aerolata]
MNSASTQTQRQHIILNATVIVASLGYFVDIYDLLLFSIVRIPSLRSLGLEGDALRDEGIFLLNVQMTGLLVGGIFWGILGDKKGRLSVLFGSIFMYSAANIANGFVNSIEAYSVWRFIAGVGLAGELGAGITLVAEILPKEKRGIGTTIVAAVGISGAVVAWFIAELFSWRTSYFIGGGLGLSLLLLRIGVAESNMFGKAKAQEARRGDFFALFTDKTRLKKYVRCILIGIPLWYVVGILITLSPEFGKAMGVQGAVNAGTAVACCYAGIVLGDIISGSLSQLMKSRLKVLYIYLFVLVLTLSLFFLLRNVSLPVFYTVCFILGLNVGYWVIFMTIATEQFGTNIRATVTTTVPNFVRGAVVPLTFLFQISLSMFNNNVITAGIVVGVFSLLCAFLALRGLQETFSKDLNYMEEL